MIVVPYELFQKKLFKGSAASAVPEGLIRYLLTRLIEASDFDEEGYLERNPDVATSIRRGECVSGHYHYAHYGYFEGRATSDLQFSEEFYKVANPDVAIAIASGDWASGEAHFERDGLGEWRSPNETSVSSFELWRSLFEGEGSEDVAGEVEADQPPVGHDGGYLPMTASY